MLIPSAYFPNAQMAHIGNVNFYFLENIIFRSIAHFFKFIDFGLYRLQCFLQCRRYVPLNKLNWNLKQIQHFFNLKIEK